MSYYCKDGHRFDNPCDIGHFWSREKLVCPICKTADITQEPKTTVCSGNYKCKECGLIFTKPREIHKYESTIFVCPKCRCNKI